MTSLLNLIEGSKQVNDVLEISSDLNQVAQLYVCYLEKSPAAYILFVPDPKWDKIRCQPAIHLKNGRGQLQNAVVVDVTVVLGRDTRACHLNFSHALKT